ncbi:MAG: hypothetical protein NTY30_00725 [Candidatus Berkelbacteria bacterium]|nr:hypothetical protein [Candidatus Berkelbacteria bacterium]
MKNRYLWYKKIDDTGSADTIHQILAFGTLEDIADLKSEVGNEKIREIFIQKPRNIYTKADFNFVKQYLLKIDQEIDATDYLKTSARNIKSRTASTA